MSKLRPRAIVFAAIAAIACDPKDAPAPQSEPRAGDATPAATPTPAVADAPAKSEAPVVAGEQSTPPTPPAAVPRDESFEEVVARLTKDVASVADPHAEAFKHYRARAWGKAIPLFAIAAHEDAVAWKHPFNLACASAQDGDETVTRVALREAVKRGGESVAKKARSDSDLADVRTRAWFEPVLRGEEPPPTTVAAATPTEPAPTEPAPEEEEEEEEEELKIVQLPRGRQTAIAKPTLTSLVGELTKEHEVKPVVRASLAVGDGSGWAVYEYSRYQACLTEHEDPKKAKKICRERWGPNEEELVSSRMDCTDQWIVRLSAIEPLAVGKPEKVTVACAMKKVRRLDALDVDGDGTDEILLDIVGTYSSTVFREGEEIEAGRFSAILRLDGTRQLELRSGFVATEYGGGEETARRFEIVDKNADGHKDVVVFSRVFEARPYVELTDELWIDGMSDEEEGIGPVTTAIWLYDAKKDAFVDPGAKP